LAACDLKIHHQAGQEQKNQLTSIKGDLFQSIYLFCPSQQQPPIPKHHSRASKPAKQIPKHSTSQ
jgi:hypothetical protein